MSIGHLEGLAAVADRYALFLIDQWGVMHDGHTPYPGAVECMANLQQMGKKIILLSNSSKRKAGRCVAVPVSVSVCVYV